MTKLPSLPKQWSRIVLYGVQPSVDGGRWPIKRAVGEAVEVVAGVLVDGHEKLHVELVYQHEDGEEQAVTMALRYNDEYLATFQVGELGRYTYRVRARLDRFGTWQDQFRRRVEGGEEEAELRSELHDGAGLLERSLGRARGARRTRMQEAVERFREGDIERALDASLAELARAYAPLKDAVVSDPYPVTVDPVLARFSAWYEFFPRSAGPVAGRHATLDDAAERLPRIKELGFDIVYLPPVHPIGRSFRKGKDNARAALPGDPGSPWAIGGEVKTGTRGGHKSVHPELGGLNAFDRFVARAGELDLKVALDIAYQTSPDHPYVSDHPDWFYRRPDGSIRYAENPPKKYQDIYPLNFESEDWPALWEELRSVFQFWIDRGVTIFRVDNPHTKPFAFWEWCIGTLRTEHPDLILLAEAFTRPKIMHTLAKLGFNQSYTYFTWRNSKEELIEYCTELFHTEVAEFYRPNFWPNTPDILHDYLVHGGRPAHVIRLVLAATLSSAYGVYGPPYEHIDNIQHPDREEYANNEKYEIRAWNWNDSNSIQPIMARINRIRQAHPALQSMRNLRFHAIDNPNILAYSKQQGDDRLLVVVNLDPHHTQDGWLHLPLASLGLPEHTAYQARDLFGGTPYTWQGTHNYVRLDPHHLPAHIFHLVP